MRAARAQRALLVAAGFGLVLTSAVLVVERLGEPPPGTENRDEPEQSSVREGAAGARSSRDDGTRDVTTREETLTEALRSSTTTGEDRGVVGFIEGSVRFEDGRPAVRVAVALVDGERRAAQWQPVTTDPDGTYRLGPAAPSLYEVVLWSNEIATTIVPRVRIEAGTARLDVFVDPGRSVAGSITDEAGTPMESFPLALVVRAGDSDVRPLEIDLMTDASGRFVLSGLGNEWSHLETRSEGVVPARWSVSEETESLELVVFPLSHALEGIVVDARSGDALRDAEVQLLLDELPIPKSWNRTGRVAEQGTRTDGAGRFRLATPAKGFAALEVSARSYRRTSVQVGELEAVHARAEPIVIELEKAGALRGSVVEEGGDAIPGVTVVILSRRLGETQVDRAWASPVVSSETGAFELFLDRLEFAGTYEVRFDHDAFLERTLWLRIEDPDAQQEVGKVVLERGAIVAGTVSDADGTPLEGVQLSVHSRVAVGSLLEPRTRSVTGKGGETDVAGRFRIEGIPPGTCTLFARLEGYYDPFRPREIEVLSHDDVQGGENELEIRLLPALALSGRCLDEDGATVAGAGVAALTQDGSGRNETTWSEADGRFRLVGLRPGTYTVTASRAGPSWRATSLVGTEYDVEAGTEDLVLLLTRRISLELRVTDEASGTLLAEFSVWLVSEQRANRGLDNAEREDCRAGRFRCDPVPPGIYRLVVTGRGYVPHDAWVQLEETSPTPTLIMLRRGKKLQGIVVDADGNAIPKASVVAYLADTSWTGPTAEDAIGEKDDAFHYRQGARSDREGVFVVEGLTSEPYRLRVTAGGFAPAIAGPWSPPGTARGERVTVRLEKNAGE